MSLLLPLPAMGVLMVMKLGGREALTQAMIIVQVSVRLLLTSPTQNPDIVYGIGLRKLIHLGTIWLPLPQARPQLLRPRLRPLPVLPLQMDRKLAFHPRVHIPLSLLRLPAPNPAHRSLILVHLHALDQTV
jgi:hypothetical protein